MILKKLYILTNVYNIITYIDDIKKIIYIN